MIDTFLRKYDIGRLRLKSKLLRVEERLVHGELVKVKVYEPAKAVLIEEDERDDSKQYYIKSTSDSVLPWDVD